MSLTLLVFVVAIGIGAVVLAVHLTGGGAPARLAGEDAAIRRFARDFPDHAVRSVHLTRDGDAAFLQLGDGRVGVVQAVGAKFLTRALSSGDLAGSPRASRATVSVRFRDFTWPGGVFAFAGPEEASAVEAMLRAASVMDER